MNVDSGEFHQRHYAAYLGDQHRVWRALRSETVRLWSGSLSPLDWADDGAPILDHPKATFVQLANLKIETVSGSGFAIFTLQDDGLFYLHIAESSDAVRSQPNPAADLAHLPVGKITGLTLAGTADGGWGGEPQVVEANLQVGDGRVALVAGEHGPQYDNDLHMRWADESVLVFPDAALAEAIEWVGGRPGHVTIPLDAD